MPPNTLRVHAEYVIVKSEGTKSLVDGRSRNHECRGLENISLPSSSMPKLWRWKYVVSPSIVEIQPASGYDSIHSSPSGRTRQ
ncbi:hypothetical protein TNCV_603801 [Trichonephila clavipes]|nr:hypothetical protein TNCV_603801 [Trichonephila clavipes]